MSTKLELSPVASLSRFLDDGELVAFGAGPEPGQRRRGRKF